MQLLLAFDVLCIRHKLEKIIYVNQIACLIISIRYRDYNLKWPVRGFSKRLRCRDHLPLVIRPAYKASLIPRRLHWPGIWRTETEQSLSARGISCHRAAKESKKKRKEQRAKKRSRHRPLIRLRPFLPWLTKECTRPDSQSVFVTLVNLTQDG